MRRWPTPLSSVVDLLGMVKARRGETENSNRYRDVIGRARIGGRWEELGKGFIRSCSVAGKEIDQIDDGKAGGRVALSVVGKFSRACAGFTSSQFPQRRRANQQVGQGGTEYT